MDAEMLLEAMRQDSHARLRHWVLRREGISPFSLRSLFIGRRGIIREACHMVLDREGASALPGDRGGSFSMERFSQMKEDENGRI